MLGVQRFVSQWGVPMIRVSAAAMCVLSLISCSKTQSEDPAPAPTQQLQSPITVTWEQAALSSTKARLFAHINRLGPLGIPLTVRIEVPPQAMLTIGRTTFELPVASAAAEHIEPIELTYSQLPVNDVVLHVTGTGVGGGVNYAVPYRFGRTAATHASPKAEGPTVIIKGRDLGPSIQLDKKQE